MLYNCFQSTCRRRHFHLYAPGCGIVRHPTKRYCSNHGARKPVTPITQAEVSVAPPQVPRADRYLWRLIVSDNGSVISLSPMICVYRFRGCFRLPVVVDPNNVPRPSHVLLILYDVHYFLHTRLANITSKIRLHLRYDSSLLDPLYVHMRNYGASNCPVIKHRFVRVKLTPISYVKPAIEQ
jgi:hypothetical protein